MRVLLVLGKFSVGAEPEVYGSSIELRMTIVESRMAVMELRMMVGLCWAALCLAQPTDRDLTSYPAPSYVILDPDRGSM